MSLLVEAAFARPSRGSVDVAAVVSCMAALSIGLSACTSFRSDDRPLPVARAASAPEVVAVPAPAMDAASAPPAALAASAPVDAATPGDLVSRRLLAYHDQVRGLSPNDLAQEINRLAALPVAPDTSLELALTLMQTRNGGELNRAIGLVDPLTKGSSPDQRAWQPFARLLMSRLLELRRLEDLLDKRNQELRDSQRDVRQLNEKLEALKAIERSLAPRPSSSSAPATWSGAASFAPASQATTPNRRNP
ncbi:MAG: hypothetical protein Q7T97_13670 [Burkholderiaceae bacterium]|nr:hypothetical protein [Burkholderiaceae bacterium]